MPHHQQRLQPLHDNEEVEEATAVDEHLEAIVEDVVEVEAELEEDTRHSQAANHQHLGHLQRIFQRKALPVTV
jgi:hypothetical protein